MSRISSQIVLFNQLEQFAGCGRMFGTALANYSSKGESFLSGSNATFLEAQYVDWMNKAAIDSSWDGFYKSVASESELQIEEVTDTTTAPTVNPDSETEKKPGRKKKSDSPELEENIKLHLAMNSLLRHYQAYGHLLANTDPLGLSSGAQALLKPKFDVEKIKLQALVALNTDSFIPLKYKDKVFELPLATYIGGKEKRLPLREIVNRLRKCYCGPIGVESSYLYSMQEMLFMRRFLETPGKMDKTPEEKKLIMYRLVKAVQLEKYFATKWPAEKRFGLDGGESFIVMVEEAIDTATRCGVESVVMAMQHRGRLNMLVNVCRKELTDVFAQFKVAMPEEVGAENRPSAQITGDIKYHLGTYIHRFIKHTKRYIKVSMSANPSHLEVVGPVVLGKTKAEQFFMGDNTGARAMAIVMHGDAAFSGQGVVYETMHLSNLPNFTTHGVLHIVCNNQIGYTTEPRFSRSSPYCSDIAKCTDAPVLHVNSDEPESVSSVARIAVLFRCKFKRDVVLDLVCYRRYGHSEEDEPMFTQPFMYKKIRTLETVDKMYAARLKEEGICTDADIKAMEKDFVDTLNKHFEFSKKITKLRIADWIDTPWNGFFEAAASRGIEETGINERTINHIARRFSTAPPLIYFEIHKGIVRILERRAKLVEEKTADWSMGEAFALGSLLRDMVHVRFTGQDVERGTMAHRHHIYHHQSVDGAKHHVLGSLFPDQAQYHLFNSSLSEFGVLGFEAGYSYSHPHLLTIWEAQYGDFADTAQCMFDTFISNAECKWISQSGLVVQLPHGIDGAGPEHSSGKPERFLSMCDDDEDEIPSIDDKEFMLHQLARANWFVCNVTSAANYFHLLRRQIALPFRKPLILFTPKVGLKHPYYFSPFKDFLIGTKFQRAIPDTGPAASKPKDVKKLIFCSGKVAITVDEVLEQNKLHDKIAMCRIEQLYPFPYDIVLKEIAKYSSAEVVFVQEEHKNQGAWPFVKPRLENIMKKKVTCVCRPPSPASATGIKWIHNQELKNLKKGIAELK